MPCVGGQPDILGIGELHHPADVVLAFHGAPDMRMRSHPYPHGKRLPADLAERVGESLELIVAGAAGRPCPHIALPMAGAERLEEIASECHMIGDGLRNSMRIDEI